MGWDWVGAAAGGEHLGKVPQCPERLVCLIPSFVTGYGQSLLSSSSRITHSLHHSSSPCLLRVFHVPGAVHGPGDTAVSKTDMAPSLYQTLNLEVSVRLSA